MKNKNNKTVIIDLGGSIVVPIAGAVNVEFLKNFRAFILKMLKQRFRFIIVVGGGKTARIYQEAARKLGIVSCGDLDLIGIHATHINAHLVRSVFCEYAVRGIIDDFRKKIKGDWKIIIASGTRPGWSTDYVSVRLAQKAGVKKIIVASNIDYVYTGDIAKDSAAKPLSEISWKDYRKLISDEWTPGMPSPVDPIAAKFAQKNGIKAIILRGTDLKNLEKSILGKNFIGTLIS